MFYLRQYNRMKNLHPTFDTPSVSFADSPLGEEALD